MATRTIQERGSSTTSSSATATCTTGIPDKYGYVSPYDCNANYNFYPSFEGNLAFAVLFGLTTIAHLIQAVAYKKRYCWVVLFGASWELVAFIIKTLGAHDQQKLSYVIYGTLLFLLAPLWINAFAYMTVSRMIYFSIPEKKIWGIRAIKLGTIFIWMDILCFLVQAGGGSMLSSNNSANTIRIGQKIYMAGIGLQLGFIVIFGSMTIFYYHKLVQLNGHNNLGRLKYLIWNMLAVLILVIIRIIYRLVEFGPGVDTNNPIIMHEVYGFTLDAFPMLLALVLLNVMHPGLVLRGPDSDFPRLSRKEKKALKKEKKALKQQNKEEKARHKAYKKALKSRDNNEMSYSVVEEEVAMQTPPPHNTSN